MPAHTRHTLTLASALESSEPLARLSQRMRDSRQRFESIQAALPVVTRGSDGMALFEAGRPALRIPVFGTDQVADVTRAGDTVIAVFTLALASGAAPAAAARLANYAGGIVVMKHATATVSADEVAAAVREGGER